MKHRAKGSKIKYQYNIIHGLRDFLKNKIEPLEYVTSIIHGEIKPRKGISYAFSVRFKYITKTGAKLLTYAPGAVQDGGREGMTKTSISLQNLRKRK